MDGGRTYTYELPAAPGDDVELRLPAGPAKLRVQVNAPAHVSVQYFLYTVTGGREPRPPHWATLGPDRETPGFTPGHGILVIRAKGRGWNAVTFDVAAQRTSTVRVQLLVSGKVEGRVAEPVADPMNRVRLVRQDGWTWSGETAVLWKSMLRRLDLSSPVAADGSFALDDVPPGSYRAIYGSWSAEIASSTVEVRSGEIAKTALTPPGR